MTSMTENTECKGCRSSVRVPPQEVARIVSDYIKTHQGEVVDEVTYTNRLKICDNCPDLQYGTTCRHCGCLVQVRAKITEKTCPSVFPRW